MSFFKGRGPAAYTFSRSCFLTALLNSVTLEIVAQKPQAVNQRRGEAPSLSGIVTGRAQYNERVQSDDAIAVGAHQHGVYVNGFEGVAKFHSK